MYIHYIYRICLSFLYDVLVVAITAVGVDAAVAVVIAAVAIVAFVYLQGYNVVDYVCRERRDSRDY